MISSYLAKQWTSPEHNVLDADEIKRLIAIAQAGYDYDKQEWVTDEAVDAKNKVILANVRLAPAVVDDVLKYNRHLFLACVNECYMSIEKSVIRYKLDSEVKFHTYARTSAKYQLMTFLEAERNTVRLPVNKSSKNYQMVPIDNYFDDGVKVSDPVVDIINKEINSLGDLNKREAGELIKKSFNILTERERGILEIVYLEEKKQARSVAAKEFDISHQRIRQIEIKSLKKLRTFIKGLENIDTYATV